MAGGFSPFLEAGDGDVDPLAREHLYHPRVVHAATAGVPGHIAGDIAV